MRPSLPPRTRFPCLLLGLVLSLGGPSATAQVVAVVSAKSPVTTLSKAEVVDIFLGKTARFPDGTPAVPIDQAEGVAARDEFYLKFANKSPAQIKAHWSKVIFTGRGQPPKEAADGAAVLKRLAQNPSAIGYLDEKLVDGTVRVVLSE